MCVCGGGRLQTVSVNNFKPEGAEEEVVVVVVVLVVMVVVMVVVVVAVMVGVACKQYL